MSVKLLDFWAPWCLDPQTPVLTEDGYIKVSQIQIGQKLITIDPKTRKQSVKKVQKVRIFEDVPSKKIILETGRELIGDINHLVLTKEGFKRLENLTIDERILVDPAQDNPVFKSDNDQAILTYTGNNFADKILTQLGLLPLKANDSRLPILARLLGFVITDGYLYENLKHNTYETYFFVGIERDAQEIKTDLQNLGFDKLEVKRETNDRRDGNRKYTISCLCCRNFNRALFFLLKSLSSPVGRKKNQAYFIPDWIMDGDKEIKRAFLSGWLGGDGCKIDYYTRYEGLSSHNSGFKVNAIEFHKEKDLEHEGLLYAEQLRQLLNELGIGVREVRGVDNEDGVVISIHLSTDYESLLNLARIGYAYAHTKNSKVPFIREFLKYRLFERSSYTELKEFVLQQLALGMSSQSIAQDLQIPIGSVTSWRYNKNAKVTHPSNSGQAKFDEWVDERAQDKLLWEKINYIEDVESRDVIGVTVDAPHTIVTNGIISHNCGPCRIMAPILEELKKELGDKLEVEEINVDENQAKSSEFGVMSIPTYVILKDGKEVGRKIGVTAKADLLKLLTNIP